MSRVHCPAPRDLADAADVPGVGGLPRGFYEWMQRPESCRSRENRQLLVQIRTSFEQSDRTYGSPRVWRDLRAWELLCGKHRVARLMSARRP